MPPRKTAAKKAQPKVEQVPAGPPIRVEIRVGRRIMFADEVYEPAFDITDDAVTFTAGKHPRMIDPPQLRAPTRFIDQTDPRDGEQIIQQVHSGRRDIIEESAVIEPEEQP